MVGAETTRWASVAEYTADAFPETCLRVQDEGMVAMLQSLTLRGQSPMVKLDHDSRTFAQPMEVIEGVSVREVMPYPVVTLSPQGLTPDPARWQPAPIRTGIFSPDQSSVLFFPWPTPWNLSYQIDIWTRTAQDMRSLRTSLWAMLTGTHAGETTLTIEYPEPYGRKLVYLDLAGDTNTSLLETSEDERTLRHTFSVTLRGWLFKAAVSVPTILDSHVIMVDGDPTDDGLREWYCDHGNYTFEDGVLTEVAEAPDYTPPDRVLAIFSFVDGQVIQSK